MKISRILSVILLDIVGINALVAGYLFITDPSGAGLGITTDELKYSPFDNYFIPGLVLFIANGLMNIGAAILVVIKYKYYPFVVFIQGMILFGWICIQILFLREFNFLHGLFLSVSILIMILGIHLNKLKKHA